MGYKSNDSLYKHFDRVILLVVQIALRTFLYLVNEMPYHHLIRSFSMRFRCLDHQCQPVALPSLQIISKVRLYREPAVDLRDLCCGQDGLHFPSKVNIYGWFPLCARLKIMFCRRQVWLSKHKAHITRLINSTDPLVIICAWARRMI